MDIYEAKGLKFYVRPGTSDIKCIKEVIEKNDYQKKGFKIEKGERWLDLGGYIGAFGILAASLGAEVEAYEPFPDSYALYRKNIELNGFSSNQINVINAAIVKKSIGSATLGINKNGNWWRNSLVRTPAKGSEVIVPTITFSSILKPGDCIKMDIEGSEFELLEDMALYRQCKKLVYEHSFDMNDDIDLYRKICVDLEKEFGHASYGKVKPEHRVWLKSWFPPCKKVFAWR